MLGGMTPVTCPRCDAKWAGLKVQHCPGGHHAPDCHLTFASIAAGDRHLVEMDDKGWSRHLTADEMRAARRRDGNPTFTAKRNKFGTEVWSVWHDPKPSPMTLDQRARAR